MLPDVRASEKKNIAIGRSQLPALYPGTPQWFPVMDNVFVWGLPKSLNSSLNLPVPFSPFAEGRIKRPRMRCREAEVEKKEKKMKAAEGESLKKIFSLGLSY